MARRGFPQVVRTVDSVVSYSVNWGHPLASGLKFCVPLVEGAGCPKDFVSGASTTTLPTWTGTVWGPGIVATSTGYVFTRGWYPTSAPASMFTLIDRPVMAAGNNAASPLQYPQPPNGGIRMAYNLHTYGTNPAKIGYTKSAVVDVVGSLASPSTPCTFGMSLVGTNAIGYLNGTPRDAINNASAYKADTSDETRIKIATLFASDAFVLAAVYAWNRQLNDAEFAQLHADPYCFLVPR